MRAQPVHDRFDEGGSLTGQGTFACGLHRVVYGVDVVAVDLHAGEAEGCCLGGEGLGGGLAVHRGRDRPLVVHAQEDHGRSKHPGEVAGLVEVAFGGGAVAEEHEHHAGVIVEGEPPGEAHGVWNLRGERNLVREHPDRGRNVAAGGVADVVEHDVFEDLGPVPAQRDRLPVLREYPVVPGVEGVDGSDDRRLVAFDGRHRAHLTLSLEVPDPL